MPAAVEQRLLAELGRVLAPHNANGRLLVAFSGGLDSSVLLSAAVKLGQPRPVAAVHVDHGWHSASGRWAARCERIAAELGLPCTVRRVDATPLAGESAEAAARRARYAAFAEVVAADDVLLTAHHGDDQLETLLLRLLRGAGVRGMRAIHAEAVIGNGRLLRPLLPFSRAELETLALQWGLDVLHDPANTDRRFDRSFLRLDVVPALRERWPAVHRVANRVAHHMQDAETLLAALAAIDGGDTAEPDRFPVARLAALDRTRQTNLLRYLIARTGLELPGEQQLAELQRQLREAPGAAIHVAWPGGEARVFRDHLYLQQPFTVVPEPGSTGCLRPDSAWHGPDGSLRLVAAEGAGIPASAVAAGLRVGFRRGGERFVPAGSEHHKSLKHWFQENGIVPWMRSRIPLLFANGELVAVGDLVLAAQAPGHGEKVWRPVWESSRRLR